MVKWYWVLVSLVVGALACGAIILVDTHGAGAKLNAELAKARSDNAASATALGRALASNAELAKSNGQLHDQLAIANGLSAGQQRTIASQQQIIDATRRGLAGIASSIAGAGGDLRKQAAAIAEGFGRLYRIYHPGGK